jgi:hypothetical protein
VVGNDGLHAHTQKDRDTDAATDAVTDSDTDHSPSTYMFLVAAGNLTIIPSRSF